MIPVLYELDGNGEVTGTSHFLCSRDCQKAFQLRTGLYTSSSHEWSHIPVDQLPLGTEQCEECNKVIVNVWYEQDVKKGSP